MSKCKTTEGPWRVRKNADGYITAVEGPGRFTVCQVLESRRTLLDDQHQDEANAQAIAAVPEMLRALREAQAYIQGFCEEDRGGYSRFAQDALNSISYALRRVEGKE